MQHSHVHSNGGNHGGGFDLGTGRDRSVDHDDDGHGRNLGAVLGRGPGHHGVAGPQPWLWEHCSSSDHSNHSLCPVVAHTLDDDPADGIDRNVPSNQTALGDDGHPTRETLDGSPKMETRCCVLEGLTGVDA